MHVAHEHLNGARYASFASSHSIFCQAKSDSVTSASSPWTLEHHGPVPRRETFCRIARFGGTGHRMLKRNRSNRPVTIRFQIFRDFNVNLGLMIHAAFYTGFTSAPAEAPSRVQNRSNGRRAHSSSSTVDPCGRHAPVFSALVPPVLRLVSGIRLARWSASAFVRVHRVPRSTWSGWHQAKAFPNGRCSVALRV